MNVGVCQLRLRLPENHSLKGKRGVVKSLVGRIASRFNVTVAEIAEQDAWQRAVIGVGYLSNDPRHTNEVLSKIVDFVTASRLDVELLDYNIEIITLEGPPDG
jgi:uncharacterized protein YlxP (DUF503 family)